MLNVPVHFGQGNSQRIVLVHGFTQTGEVWQALGRRLADAGFEVIAPDLPGHGGTDSKYDTVDLWEAGRLLAEVGGDAYYVGYSLGGRTLLHTAIATELVRAMVLVGAKAGFSDPIAAEARTRADNALADRIENEPLEQFIDDWLKSPVNNRLAEDATHRDLRLQNRPEGLAASLRYCGSGKQDSLWDELPSLDMPVLVAFAEYDLPAILEDNAGLAEAIGSNAKQLQFKGVGHSIPFEVPDEFAEAVLQFFSLCDR